MLWRLVSFGIVSLCSFSCLLELLHFLWNGSRAISWPRGHVPDRFDAVSGASVWGHLGCRWLVCHAGQYVESSICIGEHSYIVILHCYHVLLLFYLIFAKLFTLKNWMKFLIHVLDQECYQNFCYYQGCRKSIFHLFWIQIFQVFRLYLFWIQIFTYSENLSCCDIKSVMSH